MFASSAAGMPAGGVHGCEAGPPAVRISVPAIGMRRQDYFRQESREGWLRLHEKGGKRHDVPAHHRAAEALDDYLEAAGLDEAKAALFQTVDPTGQRLTGRALSRRLVLAMIKRRAAAADLPASTCCHTFRATGIPPTAGRRRHDDHVRQTPDPPAASGQPVDPAGAMENARDTLGGNCAVAESAFPTAPWTPPQAAPTGTTGILLDAHLLDSTSRISTRRCNPDGRQLKWSRLFRQVEGFAKVYSGCVVMPS